MNITGSAANDAVADTAGNDQLRTGAGDDMVVACDGKWSICAALTQGPHTLTTKQTDVTLFEDTGSPAPRERVSRC